MKKWIWALVGVLLAWNLYVTVLLIQQNQPQPNPQLSGTTVQDSTITDYTTDLTQTVNNVRSSVVGVSANGTVSSGVIFASEDNEIYLFTIALDAKDDVRIIFDSSYEMKAEVVGVDEGTDLTLLKVTPSFLVSPIRLGDSNLVEQGEYVFALSGRNREVGSASIGFGIASAAGQRRTIPTSPWLSETIEADISTTEAFLGGPLLDIGGELVGMIIHTPVSGDENMTYCVTVNEMKLVYAQLKEGGIHRGNLGIVGRNVSDLQSYEKNEFGLDLDTMEGVLVNHVSNPTDAGLLPGDLITAINQTNIENLTVLREYLYTMEEKQQVIVSVVRDGNPIELEIKLK